VTKTASAEVVASGSPLTYTVVVSNIGTAPALAVRLIDDPSGSFTYSGFSTTRGVCVRSGPVTGGRLDCDLGDFGTGAGATAVITMTGFLTAFEELEAKNDATADPDGLVAELAEGNNTDSLTTRVLASSGPNGDVTGEGLIDSVDALLILQFGGRLVQELPVAGSGDANKDGRVNALDALLILQFSVGRIDHLPP
jgi:uncharacterized repeat protein (TIGR01451 family)